MPLALILSFQALAMTTQGPLPAVEPQIAVTLGMRAAAPGEAIRVDVASTTPIEDVRVTAFGLTIAAAAVRGEWRALVGIDLGVEPGEYQVEIAARTPAGATVTARRTLQVEPKAFPTRQLTVNPRFVTPPARFRPRIEREARRLAAIFATEPAAPSWPGRFLPPIEGAVVSGFGVRSVFNGQPRAPHGGADYASPTGTPVAAPCDGRIVIAETLYYTGSTIVIDHGGGLYSLLAHLSRRDVRVGARVRTGQVVGAVGVTGRATGPHLHWTVRLHEARVDPLSLIHLTGEGAARATTSH
jgi:murein DD-endopeptidase MepM/ murein hydrolase activator NlpD